MSLIKNIKIGNTIVEIYDDCIPKEKEELRKNITNLYNVVNDIARNKKDVNKSNLFYSKNELKNIEII